MRFRVKITGRIPFLAPINLTPIDVPAKDIVDKIGGVAFTALATWLEEVPSGTVRLGPYRLQVKALFEIVNVD